MKSDAHLFPEQYQPAGSEPLFANLPHILRVGMDATTSSISFSVINPFKKLLGISYSILLVPTSSIIRGYKFIPDYTMSVLKVKLWTKQDLG